MRIYNKCKKCKKKLIYELVETQIYKSKCCDKDYIIENEITKIKS